MNLYPKKKFSSEFFIPRIILYHILVDGNLSELDRIYLKWFIYILTRHLEKYFHMTRAFIEYNWLKESRIRLI